MNRISIHSLINVRSLRVAGICMLLIFGIFACNSSSSEENEKIKQIDFKLASADDSGESKAARMAYIEAALNLVETVANDSLQLSKYYEASNLYLNLGAWKEFKETSNRLGALAEEYNDTLSKARYHYNMGSYYYSHEKRMDSAFGSHYIAEQLFAKKGDNLNAGKAMLFMAIIQKNVKDYVGGEASSVKAIEHLTESGDQRWLASANNNLGLIATELENYDEALNYLQIALQYRKKMGRSVLEASSANNIGIVYTRKGDYEEAIEYFEQGLRADSLFEQRPQTYARLLDNLAYAKFQSGIYEGLPGQFERALTIRDSVQDELGAVTSNIRLSEYYFEIDSIEKGKEYASLALAKSKPITYQRGIIESLDLLSQHAPAEQGRAYALERIKLNDSLQNIQRSFQDQFAKIRYETERLELDKEKATRQIKWLFVLLLSLLALFLLIYIFIQRQMGRRKLAFNEMQQKNNEEIYNLMLNQQAKLEEGRQLEKQRISEELHDGILGNLFGVRLSLDGLNGKEGEKTIETRGKYLNELKNIEDEIRQLSHDLQENAFASDAMYIDVVGNLVESQCSISEISHDLQADPSINWESASNSVKVHLYRIIQECLQNVRKHAEASWVYIRFNKNSEHIELTIEDDGKGISENKVRKGIGLKNIASRVRQIGGDFNISSKTGDGTIISVKFNL